MVKRAIIFGITGQDGQFLAHSLLTKGYSVLGVSRSAPSEVLFSIESLNNCDELKIATLNLLDKYELDVLIRAYMPDLIFNLSGITSVAKSFAHPVETFASIAMATENILEVIRDINTDIRFLNTGSSECFGESISDMPHIEESIYKPRSPYATAKVAALYLTDMYRSCYGLRAYSAILSNHESILRKETFFTAKVVSTLRKIHYGSHAYLTLGNLNVSRDFGWAPDYVEAMIQIVESDNPDNFIVCTGHCNTLQKFVEKCCNFYGIDMEECVKTDLSLHRPNEPEKIALCPDKINNIIGWKAYNTFDDIVEKLCSNTLF